MPTDAIASSTRRVPPPPGLRDSPPLRLAADVRTELRIRRNGGYPPGPQDFDMGRTLRMARDPLPILLSLYERYGPIFSVRILHHPVVFMLGPGGEPLHHRRAPGELPLARVELRRPGPAAR